MTSTPSLFNDAPTIPDVVQDEAIIVPRGETEYRLWLDDDAVELLARGICPEAVAKRCYGMLDWKREHYRNEARELVGLSAAPKEPT